MADLAAGAGLTASTNLASALDRYRDLAATFSAASSATVSAPATNRVATATLGAASGLTNQIVNVAATGTLSVASGMTAVIGGALPAVYGRHGVSVTRTGTGITRSALDSVRRST